jgi:hypothetical protein
VRLFLCELLATDVVLAAGTEAIGVEWFWTKREKEAALRP